MPVKYKAIAKGQPGVKGGGKQQYYATIVNQNVRDIDKITEAISNISTVSGADIRAVLYALVEVANTFLEDADIVRLGDLGSLRLSLSSNAEVTAADVDGSSIKKARILFTPGAMLEKKLKTLQFEKEEQETIKPKPAVKTLKASAKKK